MKKKDLQQLKKSQMSELEKRAADLKKEILSTKADMAAGKKKSSKKTKMLRRDLAQVLTIKRQMEIVQKENQK